MGSEVPLVVYRAELGVVVARVFISYATPDRVIADEVCGWLRGAGHEPFLAHDLRGGIGVGEEWKQRLYRELQEVDAVVGLVTRSFVSSGWCFAEVGIADSRGCWLMPLRAEADVVHPLMRDLQYTDYHIDPVRARDRVLQALRLAEGGSTWREGDNPFPGLEPFTVRLSRVFFGRRAEVREVGNRLRAMGSRGGMLVIVGPSGCGKSSLLHAGVAAVLEEDPTWLVAPSLVPGGDPLPELARVLAITATRQGLDWSASDVRARLDTGTDGLRRVADDLLATSPATHQQRLLVMVDQAEELFTRTTSMARHRFAQLLCQAVTGPVRVIAAMRSEFLDDLRDLSALAGTPIEAYMLAPLDQEALRDVIEQPAKVARLRLDKGLPAQLITDSGSGEALPLLAFILRQLAEGLPTGGRLTLSHYHDLGGVRGALARHADAALAEAVRASGLTERDVLAGFTRLVAVDENGRRGRRRIKLASLSEPLRVALGVFVNRRLLLTDTDDGQDWLTVAHEALLTEWGSLDAALSNISAALRTARAVEQAAAEWISAGRPEYFLWDDKRLTATLATLGMAAHNIDLPTPSIVTLDDDAQAFLKATARRVNMAKERGRRRRVAVIAVLSVLTLAASVIAIFAVHQQRVAFRQQQIATVRQLITQANAIRDTDPRTALLLGIAAESISPGHEALASLVNTLTTTRYAGTLTDRTNPVSSVAFSPDGRTVAAGDSTGTVTVWDLVDPSRPGNLLETHAGSVSSVAFSPDGRTLAAGSFDGRVVLWDLADLIRPRQFLTAGTGSVFSVVFSPDGRTLAAGDADGTVILWDLANPTRPRQLGSPHTGRATAVFSVAFSPDGRTIATANDDGTTLLWNLAELAQPAHSLTGHTSSVNSVAFAPDGHTLATASDDGTALLWDLTDLTRPRQLRPASTTATSKVTAVAFAPNGHALATASDDGTALLWDLTDQTQPQPLRPALTSHTGRVTAIAFAPNGHTLATAGSDATVILWDLTARAQPPRLGPPLTGQPGPVDSVRFAPDGHTLTTTSSDGTVIIRDLNDPTRPRLTRSSVRASHVVDSLAIAPDGHTMVTAGENGSVVLWDRTDRTHPRRLGQPLSAHHRLVSSAAFSADGHTLATADSEGSVILWDLTDRTRPQALGQPLSDPHSLVTATAFSGDGRTLVTTGDDGSVILWDLTDRTHSRPLGQPLRGHAGSVTAVALAPDGNILATGGSDASVILWDLTQLNQLRDHATQRACAITGGGLNHAEWFRYIPGLPYQRICPALKER
ncbi:MAG TPA: TIR domain-containing protein [Pseudonocardiaceae bacterium]|nr:TIR domain-containing protein [Pseudonocardiaceae bacterium]